jgi:DNA-binding beta-propeller fold protein YncE
MMKGNSMMLKNLFKTSLLACALSFALTGCSLEGDDGADGADGATGSQGAAGVDGADGTDTSLGLALDVVARASLEGSGSAEIVQYHEATQTIYATNSDANTVSIIDISGITAETMDDSINATNLTVTSLALPTDANGTELGDLTSIAVLGDMLAVAIPADEDAANGFVLFYSGLNASAPVFVKAVEVGNLPDMVTFTSDGTMALVANEGEPSDDYTLDPEGSVAVIAVSDSVPADTATIVDFTDFNDKKDELLAMGMSFPNPDGRTINGVTIETSVAEDLEPEYITVDGTTAYISLQENNGIAVLDLTSMELDIFGLGAKDWSELNIDVQEDGEVGFAQYDGLLGLYMPDTIDHFEWQGATFLLTANEGDAREYIFDADDEDSCLAAGGLEFDDGDCLAYTDEVKIEDLSAEEGSTLEALQIDGKAEDLRVTSALGDADNDGEYDTAYSFGARSFTIWDQNGLVVFDSGDDFERITASIHGAQFNNGDDENDGDSRSENKGPEPEALTVGTINDRTYAFIGLERMGGIFVYDITNPYAATFTTYVINRDLTDGLDVDDGIGDLAPESLVFVDAETSPVGEPLLIVGNEVSGTVSVWRIASL